jgi:hypothetical protein
LIEGFEFIHGDRKFVCSVERPWPNSKDAWWWFTVSADERHRYAPFQAASSDTRASVRTRIVAYYENLLARRAEPPTSYWRRGAPQNANGAQGNGAAAKPVAANGPPASGAQGNGSAKTAKTGKAIKAATK